MENMNNLNIKINHGKFKRLSLRININGEIVVNAPKRYTYAEIFNFFNNKKTWIEKHLLFLKTQKEKLSNYDFKNYLYLFGKKYCKKEKGNSKSFYIDVFKSILKPIVFDLSTKLKMKINNIQYTNSKRIWGSLDSKNNMKLNLILIMIPFDLVKYVIIHELCHSIEFNHSKHFWTLVGEYLPNYKELRKKIKEYDILLSQNIL